MMVSPASRWGRRPATVLSTTAAGTINQTALGFARRLTKSATELLPTAPSFDSWATESGDTSYTTHWWSWAISRRTMFAPILPSPIIPICMLSLRLRGCFEMAGVVPEQDRSLIEAMLVAERPESGRAEKKVPGPIRREPEPACRQDAKEVPAGEEEDVAGDRAHALHDPIRARADLRRALAIGAAIAKEIPVRSLGVDL